MNFLIRCAFVLACLALLLGASHLGDFISPVEADCSTDTECMRFCPPPNDDPECDGGPQQ